MSEQPQFRTVLRGYDPDQVAAAITDLSSSLTVARRTAASRTIDLTKSQEREAALSAELDAAKARLAELENGDGPRNRTFDDLGSRVSTILTLADEEAGQLRSEGERYADEVRQAAEADAARLKAAATEAADAIVLKATQEAAAHRAADAALHAKVADAQQEAAQIVDSARRDAALEARRVLDGAAEAEFTRDQVHAHLDGVLRLLDELDDELAQDVDTLTASTEGPEAERVRSVPSG